MIVISTRNGTRLGLFLLLIPLASLTLTASADEGSANKDNRAREFATDYLLGKGLDAVIDKVTGKPDVFELQRRLQGLEEDFRKRDNEIERQIAPVIAALRQDVAKVASTQEYLLKAAATVRQIDDHVRTNAAILHEAEL